MKLPKLQWYTHAVNLGAAGMLLLCPDLAQDQHRKAAAHDTARNERHDGSLPACLPACLPAQDQHRKAAAHDTARNERHDGSLPA
jgi:hypothetical protein